jgi:hypothetical protein
MIADDVAVTVAVPAFTVEVSFTVAMPPDAARWVVAIVPAVPETLKFTVFVAVPTRVSVKSHTLAVMSDVVAPVLVIDAG